MSMETTIEELDLSIRSFNCLKRAGINTVEDMINTINNGGIAACIKIRNLGRKSLEEVLYKLQDFGYPINEAVDKYIAELHAMSDTSSEIINYWKKLRDSLSNGNEELENLIQDEDFFSLDDIPEKSAQRCDWRIKPLSDNYVKFNIQLALSAEQIYTLKHGFIPTSMEQKWFVFYENNKLHFYRSWSGRCIFTVKIDTLSNLHNVTLYTYDEKIDLPQSKMLIEQLLMHFSKKETLKGSRHYRTEKQTVHTKKEEKTINPKFYDVTINGPEYGSYTNGAKGFTLFATIHNKTKSAINAKLIEFSVFSHERQWAPSYNLTGYSFDEGVILPKTSKTIGKIWTDSIWQNSKLIEKDYITITLKIKDRTHIYKFISQNNTWTVVDYLSYKSKK